MIVVLLLNIVTKSRKARIDFTVIMCLFLAFYFPVFAHVYRIMSADGIRVLLLTGFICSGIVIPAVTVSNIIYLINTSDKNKEKVHIVC